MCPRKLAHSASGQVLKYLGIKASEEEVEQMFNTADADGGGVYSVLR